MNIDWLDFTSNMVAKKVGPVAIVLINQSVQKMNVKQKQMRNSRDYLVFLKILKKELPSDIDAKELCESLWVEMMHKKLIF